MENNIVPIDTTNIQLVDAEVSKKEKKSGNWVLKIILLFVCFPLFLVVCILDN